MYIHKIKALALWYSIAIIIPLLFRPTLIVHWQVLTLFFVWGFLTITEPALPKNNPVGDPTKRSLVLLAWISTAIPLCLWAYWGKHAVPDRYTIAGACLMAAGISYRFWALKVLGRFFSRNIEIQPGHRLISKGPYRLVRHPAYTGSLLIFFGQSLFLGQPLVAFVSVASFFLAYTHRIEVEEIQLYRQFPREYDDYRRRTKKMIPFIY